MIDDMRRQLLAERLTPIQRRQLARQLRQLADELEQLAEAETNIGHLARQTPNRVVRSGAKGGRPKGSGAMTVRWDSTGGSTTGARRSGVLLIGRGLGLDTTLGAPARLDVQRQGSQLILRPARGTDGYAVIRSGNGMPRLSIGQEAADALGLLDGTYAATCTGRAIVIELAS